MTDSPLPPPLCCITDPCLPPPSPLLPDLPLSSSLKAPTALFLFALRAGGIVLGAKAGAYLVDAEPAHRDKYWMTLLTQAGVTLGLITRVGDALPISGEPASLATAEAAPLF